MRNEKKKKRKHALREKRNVGSTFSGRPEGYMEGDI